MVQLGKQEDDQCESLEVGQDEEEMAHNRRDVMEIVNAAKLNLENSKCIFHAHLSLSLDLKPRQVPHIQMIAYGLR